MDKYEQWKETEKALNLAIKTLKEKRQTLDWREYNEHTEDLIRQYDNAIRELQRCVEAPK